MTAQSIQFVVQGLLEEQAARAEAIRQLGEIAEKFPDLIEKVVAGLNQGPRAIDEFEHEEVEEEEEAEVEESSPEKFTSATKAVRHWLQENGSGTTGEITKDLLGRFETDSPNPKALLQATISSMKRRNKLVVRSNKQRQLVYSLPEEDEEEDA